MNAISTFMLMAALVGFLLVERADLNGNVAELAAMQDLEAKARELSLYVQYNAHDTNAYALGDVGHRQEYASHRRSSDACSPRPSVT